MVFIVIRCWLWWISTKLFSPDYLNVCQSYKAEIGWLPLWWQPRLEFSAHFFSVCQLCRPLWRKWKFYNLNIWIQRGKFHFNIAGNTSLFFLEEKERQKFHASSSKTAVGNQIDRPNKANINIDTIPLNVTTLKHAYIEWWENRWFLWMIMAVRYSSRTTWIVHFMVFAIINIFFASWLRAPPIIHEYVRVMRRRKDKCVDLIQFRAIWRVFMNQLERRTTSLAVVTSHCLIDFLFYRLWMPCVVNQLRVLLFRKFSSFRTGIDLHENCLIWLEQCWSWHARTMHTQQEMDT